MDRARLADWDTFKKLKLIHPDEAEKGRLYAASIIAQDPEARKRVEDGYGLEFCKRMYPEAYQGGFSRFLDKIKSLIPL